MWWQLIFFFWNFHPKGPNAKPLGKWSHLTSIFLGGLKLEPPIRLMFFLTTLYICFSGNETWKPNFFKYLVFGGTRCSTILFGGTSVTCYDQMLPWIPRPPEVATLWLDQLLATYGLWGVAGMLGTLAVGEWDEMMRCGMWAMKGFQWKCF